MLASADVVSGFIHLKHLHNVWVVGELLHNRDFAPRLAWCLLAKALKILGSSYITSLN
jgi:hypothetical protein